MTTPTPIVARLSTSLRDRARQAYRTELVQRKQILFTKLSALFGSPVELYAEGPAFFISEDPCIPAEGFVFRLGTNDRIHVKRADQDHYVRLDTLADLGRLLEEE